MARMVLRAAHRRAIRGSPPGHQPLSRSSTAAHQTVLEAGVSIDIPIGSAFQYRCTGFPLRFICITMPPWPGHHEATIIDGPWETNAPEG